MVMVHKVLVSTVVLLLSLTFVAFAQSEGWQGEVREFETGRFYTHPEWRESLIRRTSLPELDEANASDFFSTSSKNSDLLLEALTVFWIDAYDFNEGLSSSGLPVIWGNEAYTEFGERSFVATFEANEAGELEVVVLISPLKEFQQLGGAGFFGVIAQEENTQLASSDEATSNSALETVNIASYPEPIRTDSADNIFGWQGWTTVYQETDIGTMELVKANPSDALSPLATKATITWAEGDDRSNQTILDFLTTNLNFVDVQIEPYERLELAELINHETYITLGTAQLHGQEMSFFVELWQHNLNDEPSSSTSYFFVAAPTEQFVAWGGAWLGFDSLFGASSDALKALNANYASFKESLGTYTFSEQINFVENVVSVYLQANYETINEALAANTVSQQMMEMMLMQTQMNTVFQMMDMNDNLLYDRNYWDVGADTWSNP